MAKLLPIRKSLIHQRVEALPVVVRFEMCKLVNDNIFDELPRRSSKFGVVSYEPLAPITRTPESIHLTELPGNTRLAELGRPRCVQFA